MFIKRKIKCVFLSTEEYKLDTVKKFELTPEQLKIWKDYYSSSSTDFAVLTLEEYYNSLPDVEMIDR